MVELAPPSSAIEAFARADWKRVTPRLLRAAAGCLRVLGWAEDARRRPFAMEARELVNDAVEGCLSGERRWVPAAGATEESLVAFLCETMHSIAMNRRTSAAVDRRDGDAETIAQRLDERPSPSRDVAAREHLTRIGQALAADPEALMMHRMMCQGHATPAELAEALGWTAERVKVVRQRASRRLDALHLTREGDGDAPGSGP